MYFIHVGGMTLAKTIELAIHAHEIGVVILAFFSVNDREMEEYYVAVSKSIPENFPMFLYNIPQCLGNDLKPYVVERIVKRCVNVIGIKHSNSDMLRINEYLKVKNEDFSVLVGTDRLFFAALNMGCEGTVSGV